MDDDNHSKWNKVAGALRETGVAQRPAGEDLSAPHGFATRVVTRVRADGRADATGLVMWRRWSLSGAACAVALFGVTFLAKPIEKPSPQFMPVPALDELQLSPPSE